MSFDRRQTAEYVNLEGVELCFMVNLKVLREVLRTLKIDGRRWWIANEPSHAIEDGFIRVGYGDPQCHDLLNTVYFRLPVLNDSVPRGGTDRIVLIFNDPSCIADQPGLYRGTQAEVERDDWEDFISFYAPVKIALIQRMQTGE